MKLQIITTYFLSIIMTNSANANATFEGIFMDTSTSVNTDGSILLTGSSSSGKDSKSRGHYTISVQKTDDKITSITEVNDPTNKVNFSQTQWLTKNGNLFQIKNGRITSATSCEKPVQIQPILFPSQQQYANTECITVSTAICTKINNLLRDPAKVKLFLDCQSANTELRDIFENPEELRTLNANTEQLSKSLGFTHNPIPEDTKSKVMEFSGPYNSLHMKKTIDLCNKLSAQMNTSKIPTYQAPSTHTQ